MRQKPPNLESEETETEPEECAMSTEQYRDSISWKIGKSKAPPSAAKAKASGEMQKRLVVGFYILAWYVFPMYVHPILV